MAVYFIQNPINGRIKIGKSYTVRERLKTLSDQNGASLKLLGVINGGLNEESELHSRFDKTRVTGEWFLPTTKLLKFIADQAIPLDDLQETLLSKGVVLQSKIKALAQERGFKNPEAISKATDLTRTTVYNVWTGDVGKRQFSTLFIIANALKVRIEDLFEVQELTNEL